MSMTDPTPKPTTGKSNLGAQVGATAARKLKARRNPSASLWSGLGTMGLIGWSVTVPFLLGIALGLWLDQRHVGRHYWTLSLMMAGLALGCINAWYWVTKEVDAIQDEQESRDD